MKITKKLTLAFVAILALFTFVSCGGNGAEKNFKANPAKDFRYTLTDDSAGIKITEYIGKSSKIIIPAQIEGLPVVEVEGLVEQDVKSKKPYNTTGKKFYPMINNKITHIVFPDSVKKVGSDNLILGYSDIMNFQYFTALKYVRLPAGILEWKHKATSFESPRYNPDTNEAITQNYLPTFYECSKLETVIIPEGITVMPYLNHCTSLKTIKFPSTVKYVPAEAFNGCSSLEKVIVPENVEKICFGYVSYLLDDPFNAGETIFEGTNLNLKEQAKLKNLGYNGKF